MAVFDSVIRVIINVTMSGVTAKTALAYTSAEASSSPDSVVAATAVQSNLESALVACMSQWATLHSFLVWVDQKPPFPNAPGYTLASGTVGEVEEDSLPPQATMRVVKHPENSTILPVDAPLFKFGRAGFMGVPETFQNQGFLTPTGVTALTGLAAALLAPLEVDFGGGVEDYFPMMYRIHPGGGSSDNVLISNITPNGRIGGQDTRKYRV